MRGNVEDGVRRLRDLLTRFEEISLAFAQRAADFDALIAEQATVGEHIDRSNAWSLDATIERAMDALRLPDGDRDVAAPALRRRAPPRCAHTAAGVVAGFLAADEPTNHLDAEWVAWLERFLADYAGTIVAVTPDRTPRQRRGLDSGARPRQGHPVRGELLGLAERRGRLAGRRSRNRRAAARSLGSWNGYAPRRRRPRSRRRASRHTRSSSPRRRASSSTASRSTSRPGHVSASWSSTTTGSRRASATGFCSRTLRFRCRPAACRRRRPNGAGKTTLSG